MAKETWGTKRTCPKCEIRFYDLNKEPLLCPNCDNSFSLESIMEVFKKSPKDTASKKEVNEPATTEIQGIEPEDIILDEDLEENTGTSVDLEDDLLEEEEDESPPMDVIADVAKDEDET